MIAKQPSASGISSPLIENRTAVRGSPLLPADVEAFGATAAQRVQRFLATRNNYQPTPLVTLPALAARLGLDSVVVKDEAHRLGLGSFKALGGAYAVIQLALEATASESGRSPEEIDWRSAEVTRTARRLTFACATDGNHGRSVAQGAQLVGAACVIFVHSGVSEARCAAMAAFGARIVRVDGDYDDSVAEAARTAQPQGWLVVSDTAYPGYERIPLLVMQGYTALVSETLDALARPPTHVFIQAGVGGIAAALAAHLAQRLGDHRPHVTVVEPARAACLYQSVLQNRRIKIARDEPTVMAMLECYEPSLVAWRILERLGDAYMTVSEQEAIDAMRQLAFPLGADSVVTAGESGGVGMAGLTQVAHDPATRARIRLGPDARVLLVNTEGATDPVIYEKLVGRLPERN